MSSGEVSRAPGSRPRRAPPARPRRRRRTRPCPWPRPATRRAPSRSPRARPSGRSAGAAALDRLGADAHDRLLRVIRPSLTMSTAMRTSARGLRLPVPRLEHPQPALLHRELDVLHVPEVLLEQVVQPRTAPCRPRHRGLERHIWARAAGDVDRLRRRECPATTSSPWAFGSHSPNKRRAPFFGSRVNATPVAESSPMLPNTIACTFTAVPIVRGCSRSCGSRRAVRVPRREHGVDRRSRAARAGPAGTALAGQCPAPLLVVGDQRLQRLDVELAVEQAILEP
jgi:hypothetical protein